MSLLKGCVGLIGAVGVAAGVGAISAFLAPHPNHPLAKLGFGLEEIAAAAARTGESRASGINRRLLDATPGSSRAWNRQAWLEGRTSVSPAAVEALRRSYGVSPFGPTDSVWRLTYAYNRWDALPQDLRYRARVEHRLHVRTHGRSGVRPGEIANPAGRLAARMNQRRQPHGGRGQRGGDVTHFAMQQKR
ncbi:hypothetical protein ACO2Q1_11110 [Brevundimonas sp. VNH65]|uniref:hypothetical protein n=1 Tax=Brevundimonas sp. VNH65 TaxID=3400917 RepID=UPI003C05D4B8